MKLQSRLILNKYLLSLFGVNRFAASEDENLFGSHNLRDVLINSDEGFNEEGMSYFLINLISSNLDINKELVNKLKLYDQNIRQYLEYINTKREKPIILKYFQYLAVLFTEIYLDKYFNHRAEFLNELNYFVNNENKKIQLEKERYSHFTRNDLRKLAFYMATGSGKTLIMHINYLQYMRYNGQKIDNIILVTPNSGLSRQHIKEFQLSNIEADLFLNFQGSMFSKGKIAVLEITKLVETKSGEGTSIEINSFEGNNLVFIDEGHKGSSGEVWKDNREMLAREGFIFEYSATFGQAVGSRLDRSEKWDNEADYIMIGKGVTANRYFSGFIDDVYIYSDALTESEIQTLYAGTFINHTDNLVSAWCFDGDCLDDYVAGSQHDGIGTHDNTEHYDYSGEDYLTCSHTADVLVGTYTSPVYDLGSSERVLAYVLADIVVIGAGTTWDDIMPDPDTWEDAGLDTLSWAKAFELTAGPTVRMTLNYGETSPPTSSVSKMEILSAIVTGRYFQVEIEITDPNLNINCIVENFSLKLCQ